MLMKLIYTSLLAPLFSLSVHAQTTVRYVAVGGTGAGTSWADASGDLAQIMATALPNSEVWVKQGTYYPSACTTGCLDAERVKSFLMRPGVSVIGGFTGFETFRLQAASSNLTILSGDIGQAANPSDNSYNVVFAQNVGVNAGLENFTITAGNANRTASAGPTERGRAGAAIYIDGTGAGNVSNPIIQSCRLINNDVIGRGGALYCNGFGGETSPVLIDCELAFNSSRADGGAIAADGSSGVANLKLRDCNIHDNGTVFDTGTGQSGGGMYIVAQNGAAVIDLDRCRFDRNSADVATSMSSNGNSSANGGAIYLTNSGTGGMELNVRNSVFTDNSSFSAGAIYNLGGITNFTNVTVAGNRALGTGGSGGGLYINGGLATVVNSIFWDNQVVENPFGGKDVRFVNGTLNVSYTLVEATNRDALFSRASPAGSDVLNDGAGMIYGTNPLFTFGAGVPELQATSAAVNAGNNASAATAGGDYQGTARIKMDIVDLGALESNSAPLPVELIDFSVEAIGKILHLQWLVASEVRLESYRLERSIDGENFQEITEVLAMGAGRYGFDDRAALAGQRYYYRLRSVDFDGTDYLSPVVTAELPIDGESEGLFSRIYPNPTAGEMRVTLNPRENARTAYATVIDVTGRKLRMWALTTDGEHVLQLGDLPEGQYVIRLTEGTREQTAGFTIQR